MRLRTGIVLTASAITFHVAAAMAALGVAVSSSELPAGGRVAVLLATCICAVAVATIAMNQIVYQMLAPLRTLRQALRQVGADKLDVQLPERGFLDLRILTRRFNIMAERLEQSRIVDAAHTHELERDVAERNAQLERANEQLRTLDQAKDAFLSNISHEMRTPLTSILAASEILTHFTEDDPLARLEFLQIIDREGQRLLAIIESLLEFSKMQAKAIELEVAEHDLRDMVESAVESLGKAATEKNVEVAISIQEGFYVVECDRARVEQVLVNLIDNAIKFSFPGGRVDVEMSVEAKQATVRVMDEGPGVPREKQPTMFAAFGQSSVDLTDKPQGVGLGLAISAGIANAHRGSLEFEERDWRGACFVFRLPLAAVTSPQSLTHAR